MYYLSYILKYSVHIYIYIYIYIYILLVEYSEVMNIGRDSFPEKLNVVNEFYLTIITIKYTNKYMCVCVGVGVCECACVRASACGCVCASACGCASYCVYTLHTHGLLSILTR